MNKLYSKTRDVLNDFILPNSPKWMWVNKSQANLYCQLTLRYYDRPFGYRESNFRVAIMRSINRLTALSLLLITFIVNAGDSIPTEIVVRAKAKDAKFIGSSIGGALIKIKDADSGEILAQGITAGSTGNTSLIMKQPRSRYTAIAENAAAFKATLDIDKPTFLTIEVLSPYIKKQAQVLSQTQTWLVPGKPINGDGLIVEVPGMIVDILNPQTHAYANIEGSPFEIKANVVMMCGCSLTRGGIWNGDKMEVAAIVTKNGNPYKTIPLKLQDKMNTFASELDVKSAGVYQVTVYAYDPKTGNAGVGRTSFIVNE